MLCSICRKRDAALSIKVELDSKEVVLNFCDVCVKNYGFDLDKINEIISEIVFESGEEFVRSDFDQSFDVEGTFDQFFYLQKENRSGYKSEKASRNDVIERCNFCGSTLDQIVDNGHFGCVYCVSKFASKLGLETNYLFQGRIPYSYRYIYIDEKWRRYLKDKINIAITRENFEEAAKIKKILDKAK